MSDEDGMESFEVDDRDLEYAMNPGRRFYQSKNQATYGIWADDSDEDERPNRKGFGQSKKGDYSSGVRFVSGGIKQGSSLDDEKPSTSKDDVIEVDFSKPAVKKPKPSTGANVFAGMRSSAMRSSTNPEEFAGFTKHGKGNVIMNMMKAMGYEEGAGLGKDKQGIVEPVASKPRPGRGAVGAYGKEAVGPKFGETAAEAQRRERGETGQQAVDDAAQYAAPPKGIWKKTVKTKTIYKTLDDVIKEGGSIGHRAATHSGVKVIDMTGPEQRVYSGYDAIAMKSGDQCEATHAKFDIPELSHNLNLLIDLTEEEIRRSDQRVKTLQDQNTALAHDITLIEKELERDEEDMQRMRDVYELIEGISSSDASMHQFMQLFQQLKEEYATEYELFDLDKVAVPCVLPLVKQYFSRWDLLDPKQKSHGLQMMKDWKKILVANSSMFTVNSNGLVNDKLSAFDRLMWDGWMPPVRSAVLRWDPRDEMDVMLEVIDTWLPIMAPWMSEKVLDQLIVPRIVDRAEVWDPLSDVIPVHSWLVPWMQTLGDRLLPVFSPIRQKLARALRQWVVTDDSALKILRPWKNVWAPETMAAFLGQNILPKLKQGLSTMNMEPSPSAKYPEFPAILEWREMVHPDIIADVLVTSFFPRLYDTLCFWLDSPGVKEDEVKEWLFEWQLRIPQEFMENASVKECMRRIFMAKMGSRTGLAPPPSVPPPPPPMAQRPAPSNPQLSLRDVLEITASRQGITFVPQPNRLKEGRQVYWFGTLSIYMDRGVVFALDTTSVEWRPVSLDQLLTIA